MAKNECLRQKKGNFHARMHNAHENRIISIFVGAFSKLELGRFQIEAFSSERVRTYMRENRSFSN